MTHMTSLLAHQATQVLRDHVLSRTQIHSAPTLLGDLIQPYPISTPQLTVTPVAAAETAANSGSGRRKLWDLSSAAACPVTGVCLHFHDVQKMAHKAGLAVDGCCDYDVHGVVLQACRSRTAFAEGLQRELDRCFARQIQQAQRLKTTDALAQWWNEAAQGSHWADEFWAVLTHPRCSPDLEHSVLGQVHMLQHQAGLTARSDISQLKRLHADNQRLTQELAAARQRLQSQPTEQAAALAALQAQCAALRSSVIRTEAERDLARAQTAVLCSPEAGGVSCHRPVQGHPRLTDHNENLLTRALRRKAAANDSRPGKANRGQLANDLGKSAQPAAVTPVVDLTNRAVLCVGGRTQGIPIYRKVIENRGARFVHHDGGEEDNAGRLVNQLSAADLVICQVGCISHDAYWRVKEHCKRSGKPCLFVEMPSRSALERALSQMTPSALLSAA
jgi:hypothetical protein